LQKLSNPNHSINIMKYKTLLLSFAICMANVLCSCEKDDDDNYSNKITTPSTTTQKKNISKPEVSVSSRKASSSYDGWWVIAKVTTGGDEPSNVECYLEWSKFSQKTNGKH
jgi:hypothetical protein